ncbi:hypothetical protein FM104_16195 [Microbacterium esteraromaticum]|uniref:Uncharacterized protein n=1 Tax=Microbacterium esteraromaticum TaxID=57043 RepID=A0A1R4KTD5_9MICO|nr:hypothetical protein [Microbacterium esteraromaticum]SJN47495.1 hypothetical protein FM104_16195 [Microbacterium esteraromaticum]
MSRTLEAWLSPDYERAAPDSPTRLRQIADDRAVDVALAACLIALAPVAVLAGAVWGLMAGTALPFALLTVSGIALGGIGILCLRRARRRLPRERSRIVRGTGSAREGVIVFLVLFGASLIPLVLGGEALVERVPGGLLSLIGLGTVYALLLAAVFIVPGAVLARARDSFRTAAEKNPQYRALLEQDRLTWHPRHGDMMYGPL